MSATPETATAEAPKAPEAPGARTPGARTPGATRIGPEPWPDWQSGHPQRDGLTGDKVFETSTERSDPPAISVDIRQLSKHYGAQHVLRNVDLQVKAGEFVAIVGRSGCGKSTLLRTIADLEKPDAGRLSVDRSHLRLMFQDARLLPWKRVIDNVALGLGRDGLQRAREALAAVGLAERESEWPAVLSGGQRQRVALARALVHRPEVLLLDEPLGALDALTRIEMHALIESLWQERGFTALLVTHDVQEAIALGDRVIMIEAGQIVLDQRVELPRPRRRGSEAFARLEASVLDRVLGR